MEAKPMTWEEFLEKRDKIVGKDLESAIGGLTTRGPIRSFGLDADTCILGLAWMAKFEMSGDNDWVLVADGRKGGDVLIFVSRKDFKIEDLGEGRIRLTDPNYDYHVIFTEHQNLLPAAVKGMK